MRHRRQLLTVAIMTFAASSACAAIGDGNTAAQGNTQVAKAERAGDARPERQMPEAESVRQAGEKACREAVNTATTIGETFRQISIEILPTLVKTGEEFARQVEPTLRQMEPALRDLGERVREIVRQMEDSYLRSPPDKSSSDK